MKMGRTTTTWAGSIKQPTILFGLHDRVQAPDTSSKQPKAHLQMQRRLPAPADLLQTRRHLPPRAFAQLHALLLTSGHARHSLHLAIPLRLCPASPSPTTSASSSTPRFPQPPSTPTPSSSPPPPHPRRSRRSTSPPRWHSTPSCSSSHRSPPRSAPTPSPIRPSSVPRPLNAARALATHSIKFLGAEAAARDRVLGDALLDVLSRCGRIASCRRALDRIHRPDHPAWNALLSAYARRGSGPGVRGLVRRGARPVCYTGLIIIARPDPPNEITLVVVIGTTLVEMYARCGRLDLADQVFFATADRDTHCYNAILHGLAVHGHGRAALALFDRMWCHEGVPVDGVTMLWL